MEQENYLHVNEDDPDSLKDIQEKLKMMKHYHGNLAISLRNKDKLLKAICDHLNIDWQSILEEDDKIEDFVIVDKYNSKNGKGIRFYPTIDASRSDFTDEDFIKYISKVSEEHVFGKQKNND